MKLRINGFENEFYFDDSHVNVLVIENTKCYRNIIGIINDKINGTENNEIFLLDEDEEEIDFKNVILVLDLFNIEYNSKKILNKIYDIIENRIENNQDLEIEELMIKLRDKIIEEANELNFEFTMKDEFDIKDVLKLCSLKIDTNAYNTILEKTEFLIDLISTLEIADLLVIPNLKSFLDEDELNLLYKYALYNNINLLDIEIKNGKLLKYEKEWLIDENYCDRIVN